MRASFRRLTATPHILVALTNVRVIDATAPYVNGPKAVLQMTALGGIPLAEAHSVGVWARWSLVTHAGTRGQGLGTRTYTKC